MVNKSKFQVLNVDINVKASIFDLTKIPTPPHTPIANCCDGSSDINIVSGNTCNNYRRPKEIISKLLNSEYRNQFAFCCSGKLCCQFCD